MNLDESQQSDLLIFLRDINRKIAILSATLEAHLAADVAELFEDATAGHDESAKRIARCATI